MHIFCVSVSRENSAKCSDYYRRVLDRCQFLRSIVYLLRCACPDISVYSLLAFLSDLLFVEINNQYLLVFVYLENYRENFIMFGLIF